jgi:hypothetical protein
MYASTKCRPAPTPSAASWSWRPSPPMSGAAADCRSSLQHLNARTVASSVAIGAENQPGDLALYEFDSRGPTRMAWISPNILC